MLKLAQSFKRKFAYVENAFMPCTPHLLIAVNRAMRWCVENDSSEPGDYLEFGTFRGFTLWYAQALARDMGIQRMRFFGFDSFFGLPPLRGVDRGGEFQEGTYYSSRKEVERFLTQYGVDWKRTFLVEGWFDKTPTAQTRRRHGLKKCSVCVVDCDLYESARLVLEFVEPLIVGQMLILFDDWRSFGDSPAKGEQRAFAEFLGSRQHLTVEPFVEFGGHGKGFVVRDRGAEAA